MESVQGLCGTGIHGQSGVAGYNPFKEYFGECISHNNFFSDACDF